MVALIADCQVNVYNFRTLMAEPPVGYGVLRLDTNNTCNLHCVYCHNHRSDKTIGFDEFADFLNSKVINVAGFQVGCIMEPTLDKRLADFMLLIANSPARPTNEFILQTNGLLLHRHDAKKMSEAGLTRLSVSMDAADPEIQKSLRGGMSLEKVIRNVAGFKKDCPKTSVEFITTVTSANIDKLDTLVALGLDLGIQRFIFRELFYYPDNDIVDHSRMPGLMLRKGQFWDMADKIKAHFGKDVELIFAANEELDASARTMTENSKFVGRELGAVQLHATK